MRTRRTRDAPRLAARGARTGRIDIAPFCGIRPHRDTGRNRLDTAADARTGRRRTRDNRFVRSTACRCASQESTTAYGARESASRRAVGIRPHTGSGDPRRRRGCGYRRGGPRSHKRGDASYLGMCKRFPEGLNPQRSEALRSAALAITAIRGANPAVVGRPNRSEPRIQFSYAAAARLLSSDAAALAADL